MHFLVWLSEKYSPALTPVLIVAVICLGLVISLLLVLLAFFPTLADSIVHIVDSLLYPGYRRHKNRSVSGASKRTKRTK